MTEIPTSRREPEGSASHAREYLARIVREPLSQFLLLGGLMFLVYSAVSEPIPTPSHEIVIEPANIESLVTEFRRVWTRDPSDAEMAALLDEYVREEVYYREALALGLDRDDVVVRRRLRQKMEFLTDTGADLLEPSERELRAFLQDNMQRYRQSPRVAFVQVFFGATPPAAQIESTLRALQSNPRSRPRQWGESTLLPEELEPSPSDTIDGLFGVGFFEQLEAITSDTWAGPVTSPYGVHLVRITARQPATVPQLEQVRDAVVRDWKAAKTKELREQLYARLRDRYVVEVRVPGQQRLQGGGR